MRIVKEMQELIKITDRDGQSVVSARELYEFLDIRTPFDKWIPRMLEYGFEEGIDFSTFLSESTGGRPSTIYALTLDTAKEIAMIQRSEKGRRARRYFIECEKIARAQRLPDITTMVTAIAKERMKLLYQRSEIDAKIAEIDRVTSIPEEAISLHEVYGYHNIDFFDKHINNWCLRGYIKTRDFRSLYTSSVEKDDRIGLTTLYQALRQYCRSNGITVQISKKITVNYEQFRVHVFKKDS